MHTAELLSVKTVVKLLFSSPFLQNNLNIPVWQGSSSTNYITTIASNFRIDDHIHVSIKTVILSSAV